MPTPVPSWAPRLTPGKLFACLAAIAAAIILTCMLLPGLAFGHASLVSSEPTRGAVLEAPPTEVVFNFNEGVDVELGGIRVFNAAGEIIPTGEIERPGGSAETISASLPADLADGTYTATFRAVSADSHPISGGILFTVGEPGAGPSQTVGELLAESEAGPITSGAFWFVRLLSYLAIGIGVGTLAFALLVWNPALRASSRPTADSSDDWRAASEAMVGRLKRVVVVAAIVGVLTAIAAIGLQAANVTGQGFFSVFGSGAAEEILSTRLGEMTVLRGLAWIAFAGIFVAAARQVLARPDESNASNPEKPAPRPILATLAMVVLVLLGVAIAATPMLSGHASVYEPTWLLAPVDLIHVLAMSAWLGGLALIGFALPAATRKLEGAERPALLAATLLRFSPMALACVITLVVTGAIQTITYLDSFADFVDTAFGRALLVKIGLLLVLIALGALNRRRMLPALQRIVERGETATGATGRAIRRSIRAEVLLVVAVLGATAVLVSSVPSGSVQQVPQAGDVTESGLRLEYTVDPAVVGANEVHIYLFSEADGSQFDPDEVTANATLPARDLGPIPIDLSKSGPGHYTAPSAPFGVAGAWTVDIDVRTGRFDQVSMSFPVEIE